MCLWIITSSIFLALYGVWIIWSVPLYFFFFETIIILVIIRNHFMCKKYSLGLMTSYQGMLDDECTYKELINKYGVYIYAPRTAVYMALSFTACILMGYLVIVIMLLMQRWSEAALCFANAFLCEFMSAWLNPVPLLIVQAAHNEEDSSCKDILIIENLCNLVAIHLLLKEVDANASGEIMVR